MRISVIIDAVKSELIADTNGFWTDAQLLALANRAEANFCLRTRCYEGTDSFVTEIGDNVAPFAADWIHVTKIFYNDADDAGTPNWFPLAATTMEKLSQEAPNFLSNSSTTYSTPRQYYIQGENLYIHPRPDKAREIKMWFVGLPPALTSTSSDINIPTELSEGINEYMLWKCWDKDQESELAEKHHVAYESMIEQGLGWVKRKQLDARHKIDLVSPVPYSYGPGSRMGGINPLNL